MRELPKLTNSSPDWRSVVRERLELRAFDSVEVEEITGELAAHFEDLQEQYREEGLSESQAVASALDEVSDWRKLSRKIRRARQKENQMNQRTKAVWIPGLISLTAASGILALLQVWGVRPHVVWMRSGPGLILYVPWLAAQPIFGAVGAYISRRNGGDWRERLTASLLPAAAMVATFCVGFCIQIARSVITNGHEITAAALSLYVVWWAVVPGFALALGALPFLGKTRIQEAR